jgi:Uncharacterized protein family UPF0004
VPRPVLPDISPIKSQWKQLLIPRVPAGAADSKENSRKFLPWKRLRRRPTFNSSICYNLQTNEGGVGRTGTSDNYPQLNSHLASRYNQNVSNSIPKASPVVGFVSLGCPKNLVDSEVMMGLLDRAGARLTARPEEADILVVNTCSFIDTAKQESVDTILEMAKHKTEGRARKLIVAGCLVERYRDEIRKNIPEVDAVVGTGELEAILEAAGMATPPAV